MQAAPYGSWTSRLGADELAAATVRFGQVAIAGGSIFASEGRPAEGGRNVVVECRSDGTVADVNPAPFDVRTRVHEYGGGAFLVAGDGELFFSHDEDQRLWHVRRGEAPRPVTKGGACRYADARPDAARGRLVAVREDHSDSGEAVATIVAIDLASGDETALASGHDFFSNPRLSPDGRRLAWLSWDHPRMPWQGSDLWVAELDAAGRPLAPRHVAGGEHESIFQPEWSPAGELHFASDRSGWWNLCRERAGRIEPLHAMAAEFGEPQWEFGLSMYGFAGDGSRSAYSDFRVSTVAKRPSAEIDCRMCWWSRGGALSFRPARRSVSRRSTRCCGPIATRAFCPTAPSATATLPCSPST